MNTLCREPFGATAGLSYSSVPIPPATLAVAGIGKKLIHCKKGLLDWETLLETVPQKEDDEERKP